MKKGFPGIWPDSPLQSVCLEATVILKGNEYRRTTPSAEDLQYIELFEVIAGHLVELNLQNSFSEEPISRASTRGSTW